MATQQAVREFHLPGAAAQTAIEAQPRLRRADRRDGRLAGGLGWFSVGLGMAEMAAPGRMAQAIGVSNTADNRDLLRAAGLREIASGIGILTRDRQAGWIWARVGGDVMDLALLGFGFTSDQARPARLAAATAAVAGVAALDVMAGRRLAGESGGERFEYATRAITVNRPPAEVYRFWRDFENLPTFMRHLESVKVTSAQRSRWTAKGPAGTSVEWEAEMVGDRANELIAWRSLPGADVENSGSVHFKLAPGNRGTEVIVRVQYAPPAGAIGAAAAWLFGEEPDQQLHEDLRRFKQVMETGEIARSEASESALGFARPGRPAAVTPYDQFARGDR
jgi:uncharacterized membrane protein